MHMINKKKGFTLIEMVVVITITAIIGGISSLIISRSLDAYASLDRRQKIQTSLRLVIERISRELRNALPNSLDISPEGKLFFIPIKSSGRYQNRRNGERLEIRANNNNQNDRFHVLSTNATLHLDANAGDWIVVNNLNDQDVYAPYDVVNDFNNVRHKILSVTLNSLWTIGGTPYISDLVIFDGGNKRVPTHSPTRRFSVIDNNRQVALFYKEGSKLFRDTTTFDDPAPALATGNQRLLMENVTNCLFTKIDGTQSTPNLLRIDLTVEIQGEKVQVVHEAQVFNVP